MWFFSLLNDKLQNHKHRFLWNWETLLRGIRNLFLLLSYKPASHSTALNKRYHHRRTEWWKPHTRVCVCGTGMQLLQLIGGSTTGFVCSTLYLHFFPLKLSSATGTHSPATVSYPVYGDSTLRAQWVLVWELEQARHGIKLANMVWSA